MKELSLNVLDIVENSVKAGATLIRILLEETEEILTLTVEDNGCGMREEILRGVIDPFYTTRTTRKVGLGIPLLKLAAEQTGGNLHIESVTEADDPSSHGTVVTATFHTDSIDFTPIGDMVSTMCVIIQGHPEIDYVFKHRSPTLDVELDTAQVREMLGEGISLAEPEIIEWLAGYLSQQYE